MGSATSRYWDTVRELQQRVVETQQGAIDEAARLMARTIEHDGLVHAFGSGHSMVFAKELFNRSGGLVPISPIFDANLVGVFGGSRKVALLEQHEGYARFVLEGHDVVPGEPVIIFSAAGRNPVSLDLAAAFHAHGGKVIGVTSVAYSDAFPPRHSSGKRLHEVADIVIDNMGAPGDASLELAAPSGPIRVGATSSITGMLIAELLVVRTVEVLIAAGVEPPIVSTTNVEGAVRTNMDRFRPYLARLRHY